MQRALRSIFEVVVFVSVVGTAAALESHARASPMGANDVPRPQLQDYLLDRFIVVPEYKLLFCYIEKVGCMNFNQLFKEVRSKFDPTQLEGNPWYKNTPTNHSLTKADLENILVDESWHKAVFWRDPVERFASAFKSKCENADDDGALNCEGQFGVTDLAFTSAIAFFETGDVRALELGKRFSSDESDNEHFKRMSGFCGGVGHNLRYYNTVEELTVTTSHEKVSKMLRTVGIDPAEISMFDSLFPPAPTSLVAKPIAPENVTAAESAHNTGVESQMSELFPPTQPWLMEAVAYHYRSDYMHFKIGNTPTLLAQHNGVVKERWPLLDTVWQAGAPRLFKNGRT